MSDQLCGHWYHKACLNADPFLPQDKVSQSLQTIFNFNVMKNKNGTRGAVNGMTPMGHVDLFTLQSEETWIGVTYGLAATLIHEVCNFASPSKTPMKKSVKRLILYYII